MSKTKQDKKLNRRVKEFNKALAADVFKDRFWFRQVKKVRGEGELMYYLYEMKDRLEPERDTIISHWIWGGSQFIAADLFAEMNDFIINSDFWHLYWKNRGKDTHIPDDPYKNRGI